MLTCLQLALTMPLTLSLALLLMDGLLLSNDISAVFTWDSDLFYRMNQRVLTVYHQAFDLTSINDLDPTLFAFHVSQILAVLLFNRVQIAKTDIIHYASLLGSHPVQSRIIKPTRFAAYSGYIYLCIHHHQYL
jgi:hypothetical protein